MGFGHGSSAARRGDASGDLEQEGRVDGRVLPDEIMEFLAHRIRTNIRRLEGALIRVASHASLTGKKLNVEVVEGLLREILHEGRPLLRKHRSHSEARGRALRYPPRGHDQGKAASETSLFRGRSPCFSPAR